MARAGIAEIHLLDGRAGRERNGGEALGKPRVGAFLCCRVTLHLDLFSRGFPPGYADSVASLGRRFGTGVSHPLTVSRFRNSLTVQYTLVRTSQSKGYWQLYNSSAFL